MSRHHGVAELFAFGLLVMTTACLVGCGSTTTRSGEPQVTTRAAASNDEPTVRRVVLMAARPRDRDGDRSPDQYPVMVLLFGRSELPVHAAGTLIGELRLESGDVVRRWVVPPESLQQAARDFPAGPGYELGFQLELDADRRAREPADLVVWFVPAGLDPDEPGVLELSPIGSTTLHVGGAYD
jgi:hypothetical protein